MVWHGLRIKAILVALGIGLVCLFGGQFLYEKYGYQQALYQALAKQPQVADFAVGTENGQLVVTVRLRAPGNLMLTYQELKRLTGEALGNRPFILRIADNRDAVLEEVFYRSQFVIYQALAQGSFREMEKEVNRYAQAAGAEARIYIDNENLYVTLTRGDHFLATVICRSESPQATGGAAPYA